MGTTHYHELTDLANTKQAVANYNVAVRERNEEIIFLHKILPGAADKSYGIQVARLAGLPKPDVERAYRSSSSSRISNGTVGSFVRTRGRTSFTWRSRSLDRAYGCSGLPIFPVLGYPSGMAMFDTIHLKTPLVCPTCGGQQHDYQTHAFDDIMANYRIGSRVGGGVLTGIVQERFWCSDCILT